MIIILYLVRTIWIQKKWRGMSSEPIEIEKLDISTRLKHCLICYGFNDLQEVSSVSKETLFRIRNMGDATYKELQEQCDKYGIVIRSEKDVIDRSRGIKWSWQQCSRLFEMGIRSIEDIKSFPMEEIEKIQFSMPEIYGRLKDAKRKLESES